MQHTLRSQQCMHCSTVIMMFLCCKRATRKTSGRLVGTRSKKFIFRHDDIVIARDRERARAMHWSVAPSC
eukprot:m.707553 g.707553  ORF g.707553 m.707553 type:complete len:70 (+) comp22935_c0_seq60:2098-2307(+)